MASSSSFSSSSSSLSVSIHPDVELKSATEQHPLKGRQQKLMMKEDRRIGELNEPRQFVVDDDDD